MTPSHLVIEPIVDRNFGNKFQHQNGPNQRQRIQKITSQQYKPISYQIPSTPPTPYLEKDCIGFVINHKVVRELSIQYDGKLETCPFR